MYRFQMSPKERQYCKIFFALFALVLFLWFVVEGQSAMKMVLSQKVRLKVLKIERDNTTVVSIKELEDAAGENKQQEVCW